MSDFKLETVKWKWAEKVQSKNVYRDYKLIRTSTKEEAISAIDYLFNNHRQGLTYIVTVFKDNEYLTYLLHSMPCLGGLVKYRDTHGKKYSMNPYFPRDIYFAFPDGDIIFIACQSSPKLESDYIQFILSDESPWISAFGHKDTIIFNKGYFILTNMETDPTVFYSLMRLGGFTGSIYDLSKGKSTNPKSQILLSKMDCADPRRLAGQKPIIISGGTWAEGFGFTRPYNESIFKLKLPHKLSGFKKLGSYPDAPHDNTYFIKTMTDVFKIDVNNVEKFNSAADDIWSYFKEESKKLDDGFPK